MGIHKKDTFIKPVKANNFMRVIGVYGIQYDAFSEFKEIGIKKITVYEQHTKNKWQSKVKDWELNGKIADYGNGKQIFLSLKFMSFVKKEPEKEQVSMFTAFANMPDENKKTILANMRKAIHKN